MPENREKLSKVTKIALTESRSDTKKVVSSAYADNRKTKSRIHNGLIESLERIIMKNTSRTKIKRYAAMGSPCRAPRFKLEILGSVTPI